jgi:hypothetical protein
MSKRFQNRFIAVCFAGASALGLSSCTHDIVEPDLSKETVVLLAPADSYTTTTLTHLFWWEEVENAKKYNLQVVKPGFSNIQQLLLDTNVTSNKFTFTLTPGTFQWRVKAFNSATSSPYSIFTLTIDSTVDLSAQTVVLVSPAANLVTKIPAHTFTWIKLYNASEYRLQVINASNSAVIDVIKTEDTATYTLSEGVYTWQVRAQNSTSFSPYSTRTITIDMTSPAVSVQNFPANNDTITGTDSLDWSPSAGAVGDSLFIYADSLMTTTSYKQFFNTVTYYAFTGTVNQDYFWQLKSVDAAGNWSAKGTLRKFWVK